MSKESQAAPLWPWQKQVADSTDYQDRFQVNVMVGDPYNKALGVDHLFRVLEEKHMALEIPFQDRNVSVSRYIGENSNRRIYVAKIHPKKASKIASAFWKGMEKTAKGEYDLLYHGKVIGIATGLKPSVWVFTSEIPPMTHVSKSHYVFWKLENSEDPEHSALVKFIPDPEIIKGFAARFRRKKKN